MSQTQEDKKALQIDEEARSDGMEQLQNWGRMLRSEPRVGPAGFKASPMFKEIVSRYADDAPRVRETFRADDAYLVMDLIEYLIKDEFDKKAVYLFYAEPDTYSNTEQSLSHYNEHLNKSGIRTISETRFRKILVSIEVRIGTGIAICGDDKDWMVISKLMAS